MTTAYGHKVGPRLIQLYGKFEHVLEPMNEGDRLRLAIDKDRNGKFNALYHVMLDRLTRAINRGPAQTSTDALKRWVKLKTGRYDVVPLPNAAPDGTTHAIDYHSTSFASMGEAEFHAFAMDTCDLIRAELAPWVSGSPEWAEVKGIINSIAPAEPVT